MRAQKNDKVKDFQQETVDRTSKSVKKALKEILQAIVSARSLSPESFVKLHLGEKRVVWPAMSVRNKKIKDDFIAKVNEELNKIPTFSQSFDILAEFAEDRNIRKKFVEKITFPHVMALIAYIDEKRKKLVNG